MMNFDVLQGTISLNQHLFIEASAGTGKTFTIEHLVVRRLLEPTSAQTFQSFEQIAVITFTNACAYELKQRIKKTIEYTIDLLSGSSCEEAPEYVQAIFAAGAVVQAQKILRRALSQFSNVTISTIHAFCYRALSEYRGEPLLVATSQDITRLIHDFFLYGIQEEQFFPEQVAALIKTHGGFVPFVELLRVHLWRKENKENKKALQTWNELLAAIQEFELDEETVLAILEAECERYKNIKGRDGISHEVACKIKAFAALFSPNPKRADFLQMPLIFDEVFQELKVRAPLSKYEPLFERMRHVLQPFIKELACTDDLFLRLVAEVELFVERAQEANGSLSIERCLHAIWQKTQDEHFCVFMRERYHTLIVDEFQDTDPLQWKIVKKIYLDEKSQSFLYLVGDPKQAIYRFRGADIYSYLEAKSALRGGSELGLTTNFRSSHALNEGLNFLFSAPHAKDLFLLPDTLETVVARALHTRHVGLETAPSIFFCMVQGSKGRSSLFPSLAMEEKQIFPFILETLLKEGVEKTAILVKDRYQARRVVDYLSQRGIQVASAQTITLEENEPFHFLKRICGCMEEPRRMGPLATLLLAYPFFLSFEYCELLRSLDDKSLQLRSKYVERFLFLKKTLEECGFPRFFNELMDFVAANAKEPCAEEMECMFDLLAPYSSNIRTASALISQLKQLKNMTEEERSLAKPTSEAAVQVLTMHKSKGLEFDVVFSLGTASRTPVDSDKEEADHEKLRQFYVCATRAKKKLYLCVPLQEEQKEVPYGTASAMELYLATLATTLKGGEKYQWMDAAIQEEMVSLLSQNGSIGQIWLSEKEISKSGLQKKTMFFKQETRHVQVEPVRIETFSVNKQSVETASVEKSDFLQGASFGRRMHELIAALLAQPKEVVRSEENIHAWFMTQLCYMPEGQHIEKIVKMLYMIFHAPFSSHGHTFTLSDEECQVVSIERPFYYRKEQAIIHGIVDLVIRVRSYLYIIDWKTHTLLDGYDHESLRKVIEEGGYSLQAKMYRDAYAKYIEWANAGQVSGFFFVFVKGVDVDGRGIFLMEAHA